VAKAIRVPPFLYGRGLKTSSDKGMPYVAEMVQRALRKKLGLGKRCNDTWASWTK